MVKEIAGEDGMTLCRFLLDGIEDDGDADLQGRVTEGRCTGNLSLFVLFVLSYINLSLLVLSCFALCDFYSI